MNRESAGPGGIERALAATCYLGFAPFLPRALRRERPFLHHHFSRGLITSLLLVLLILLQIGRLGAETHLLRNPGLRGSAYASVTEDSGYGVVALFALWLIAWLAGLICAVFGSTRTVPPLGWLGRRRWCVRVALVAQLSVWIVGLLIAVLTWHADSIARDDIGPAEVYVLIDKPGAQEVIPDSAVTLASYRLALVARERWGSGSIVVTPLNELSLRAALRYGRFVVIWSHGSFGYISMPDGWVMAAAPTPAPEPDGTRRIYFMPSAPDRLGFEPVEVGDHLQFLYSSACYAGISADAWAASLAPAKIVMYDRISGGLEHILWLLLEAPQRVREVR